MKLQAWQSHPHERKFEERHKRWKRKKKEGNPAAPLKRAANYVRDWVRDEHHRCGCGCGEKATVWRDREWYHKGCVSDSAKWAGSQLPEDRTPPLTRRDKRRINQDSRWLDKRGHGS